MWTVSYTQDIYVGGGVVGSYRSLRSCLSCCSCLSRRHSESEHTSRPGSAGRGAWPIGVVRTLGPNPSKLKINHNIHTCNRNCNRRKSIIRIYIYIYSRFRIWGSPSQKRKLKCQVWGSPNKQSSFQIWASKKNKKQSASQPSQPDSYHGALTLPGFPTPYPFMVHQPLTRRTPSDTPSVFLFCN